MDDSPRERQVERMRVAMERNEYPRLRMLLIVALTGGSGFLASYLMLRHGIGSIALRYPLALCIAYVAFLLLIWAWLRSRSHDYLDTPDAGDLGGSWRPARKKSSHVDFDTGPFDGFGFADDLGIPIAIVAIAAIVAFSSLWVVYVAPTLFAELLFDGILAAGLYRRLRRGDPRHWLDTALRKTLPAFAITLVALAAFGLGVQHWRPGVHSIGDIAHRFAAQDAGAP